MVSAAIIILLVALWEINQGVAKIATGGAIQVAEPVIIERSRDMTGAETVRATTVVIPPALIKELLNKQNKTWEARMMHALREQEGRFARLVVGQRVAMRTVGGFKSVVRDSVIREIRYLPGTARVDTVYRKVQITAFADPWLLFNGVLKNDTLYGSYRVRNEQRVSVFTKKKNWWNPFEKRKTFVTLKNMNPNSTVDSLQVLVIPERRRILGIF